MTDLPIHEVLPTLQRALAEHSRAVLEAPPGAGKTTVVPLALLREPWLQGRSILMLEPRRLAARAAASRMAQLLNERVGETVGYRIRFESQVSRRTRVEVLTEGILTRRLQSDAALEDVGLVIFDEFHERHVHTDLALALCLDSQRVLRPDLKILIMSATLDGAALAERLEAPRVVSAGRMFPVDIHYLARDADAPLAEQVSASVARALTDQPGDVLAFLPGGGDIRRAQEALMRQRAIDVEVLPLYGDLPWEAQERAICPAARRKVVLATPIAETSLTIEGVRIVVDSGFARTPQFDPTSGLTRLATVRISRAAADQRAGRAGRLAPGVCYRLWSETTQKGLVRFAPAELRGADLAPLALELALWGARDVNELFWLDPPPAAAMDQARELLRALDAIDGSGAITDVGRAMAMVPLHPRLAHMLRTAQARGLAGVACDIAALLSERDIFIGAHARSCDLMERLEALHARHTSGADEQARTRVKRAAAQYRRVLGCDDARSLPAPEHVGELLAAAYPDRVAASRGPNDARYLLASGRGARLPERERMLRKPYLVAASMDAGEGEGMIHLAAAVTVASLRTQLASHVQICEVVRWDDHSEAVMARREERLGAIVLDSAALAAADPATMQAAMQEGVRRMGIASLPWDGATRDWQARVLSLRHWFPEEPWPDVSDAALLNTLATWLAPYLDGITRRAHLSRVDLTQALAHHLDWKQGARLNEGAPTHLTVPSGSSLRLDYVPGQAPVLAVKLQEMFGLADTPRVAWGKVAVTLHLLSPARRPIQVTQDLRGFWERTYLEVKKELKGRYPKHPWPDDPWSAPPTARAKRRS